MMQKILIRLWPRRLGSQFMGLIILAVVATFALYGVLSLDLWRDPEPPGRKNPQQAVLDLVLRPIAGAPANDPKTAALFQSANVLAPDLDLRVVTADNAPPRKDWVPLSGGLESFMARIHATGFAAQSGESSVFIAELQNGTIIAANLFPPVPPPRRSKLLAASFLRGEELILLLIILPIALLWAASRLSTRLRAFARAAEEFSMEGNHDPLPETGPEEIRIATRAFNRMRERLAKFSTDRTRMLSAIGHDLRTPVTRMRLRAEFIKDDELREGITRDIARMDVMIESALNFFRDGRADGTRSLVDIPSLLQTLCDNFTELDGDILCDLNLSSSQKIQVNADPGALERALENLVHNGLKHAAKVRVSLHVLEANRIAIDVDDDGPGIPPDMRADYLKPFISGDQTGHESERAFGLGLSISSMIANAHGGTLELSDSAMGGLRARLILPNIT